MQGNGHATLNSMRFAKIWAVGVQTRQPRNESVVFTVSVTYRHVAAILPFQTIFRAAGSIVATRSSWIAPIRRRTRFFSTTCGGRRN